MSRLSEANKFSEEEKAFLRNPMISLPLYGLVPDQEHNGKFIPYDPFKITKNLQNTILHYAHNPPRDESDHVKVLNILAGRQSGKSLTCEYAMYPLAAYSDAWDHVCIADTPDRAEYLHSRLHILHDNWNPDWRMPNLFTQETRQISFANRSKMRVLVARNATAGIGQSCDSSHWSEVPFCENIEATWSYFLPTLQNRRNAFTIRESTPAPLDASEAPSAEVWRDWCLDAYHGLDPRSIFAFFPFWDSFLNQRPWSLGWTLEKEEEDLLHRYSAEGLTLENLAFRRSIMASDKQIRSNPELFAVFYPFDPVTCWRKSPHAVTPRSVIDRLSKRKMVKWVGPYMEYKAPNPEAVYVIGVDPVGFAARNHAAFEVAECWLDEIEEVAAYAEFSDPLTFTDKLIEVGRRYNNALIVVESTGVGQAVLALLIARGYSNVYYSRDNEPGVSASLIDLYTADMFEALLTRFTLNNSNLFSQLETYRADKKLERAPRLEMLSPTGGAGRRQRHHWDSVSALCYTIFGAKFVPAKFKPRPRIIKNYDDFTYGEFEEYRALVARSIKKGRPTRFHYTRRR